MSFKKPGGGGEVYYYRFRDIAVQTYVGIITCPAGYMERKGYNFSEDPKSIWLLLKLLEE